MTREIFGSEQRTAAGKRETMPSGKSSLASIAPLTLRSNCRCWRGHAGSMTGFPALQAAAYPAAAQDYPIVEKKSPPRIWRHDQQGAIWAQQFAFMHDNAMKFSRNGNR